MLVEDGSGIVGANSLATTAQARTYAAARGLTLPSDTTAGNAALTAFLVLGTDYLKQYAYLGSQTYNGPSYLPWPRKCVRIAGETLADDAVPQGVIDALSQLCVEQQNGVILFPGSSGPAIRREKIGPLETEYAVSNGTSNAARMSMPAVDALLKPYRVRGFGLRVGRA